MQNDDALAVGVDFGTDSARALLVRTCDGEVLASCAHPYARWGKGLYSDAAQMRFRQHPHDYAEAQKRMCAPSCATYTPRPNRNHDARYALYKQLSGI